MKPGWVPSWCEWVLFHPQKAKLCGFSSPMDAALPGTASPSRLWFGTELALQHDCARRLHRNLPLGPAWAAELFPGCRSHARFRDTISDPIRDEELALDRAPSNCPSSTVPGATTLKALEGAHLPLTNNKKVAKED